MRKASRSGPWLLYAEVSDGGALSGAFAPGPIVLYEKGDANFDGRLDRADLFAMLIHIILRLPPEPPLDMDRDGDVDRRDLRVLLREIRLQRASAREQHP